LNFSLPDHSVLRQCLSWVNTQYKDIFADHRSQKFCTGQIISLMLVASLRQWKSLEQTRGKLRATPWLKKWLNMDDIGTSTLHERLENIPLGELQDMYQRLLEEIFHHYQGKKGLPQIGLLHAIDSTELILPPINGGWAHGTEKKNFVRMHTCLRIADQKSTCPIKIVLSTGNVHELEVVSHLVTSSDATHVFDRGYVKYEQYHIWAKQNIPFVARIKDHCVYELVEEHPHKANFPILLDAEVRITNRKTKEAFQLRLVEYEYQDLKGNWRRIRVLTNRRDLSAEQVSEVYRGRWKVELFFKWMKQHVNLTKWYSHKPRAVWNQIYLSLIAHALCEWIRLSKKPEASCWQILSTILTHADDSDKWVNDVLNMIKIRPTKPPDKGKVKRRSQEFRRMRAIIT